MIEKSDKKLVENARSFCKDLVELARKYNIVYIGSCENCGGVNLEFADGKSIDELQILENKNKITASFKEAIIDNGLYKKIEHKVD